MGFSLRCPDCREKFPWKANSRFPSYCPLCSAHIGHDRADDDIVMPSIRSITTTATDNVYRQMETASESRAQEAAQLANVPIAEMSNLKLTNMRDGMANRGAHVGFQGGNGLGYSGAVAVGPGANSGANFQTVLRQHHAEATNYQATGDRPANELFQPGYRPRARW